MGSEMCIRDRHASYHCADKHNSNGAGDHDGIGSLFSVTRQGELHFTRVSLLEISNFTIVSEVLNSPHMPHVALT